MLLPLAALVALAGPFLPGPVPSPDLQAHAEALLAGRVSPEGPGAVVLLAREGRPLFRKGYGLASLELKTPMHPGMVFRIGSLTKQFTAACILLLAEEGRLDLQAPLSRYLEGLPQSWSGVTVELLLNHSSGIPDYTSHPAFGQHFREDFTPSQLLEAYATSQPLEFEPGLHHRYSNTGYVLLGQIIEKVSARPWDAFMEDRIFKPLGLKQTRRAREEELVPGLVQGYTEGPLPAPYLSMTQPGAAGALLSCADDLVAWTSALHGGRVLRPQSLARMLSPTRTRDGVLHPYGYGLAFRTSQGRRLVGHAGGIPGFSCYLEADPAAGAVAVVLHNTDTPQTPESLLTRRLLALGAGAPIPLPKPVPLTRAQLAAVAGRYRDGARMRTLSLEGDRLYSLVEGGTRCELIPLSPTRFLIQDSDITLRAVLQEGRVTGLHRRVEEDPEGPLQPRVPEDAAK